MPLSTAKIKVKSSIPPSYWLDADLSSANRQELFEQQALDAWALPKSTYGLLHASCRHEPEAIAIDFFSDPARCEQTRRSISYRMLLDRINQTGNLLRSLGIGSQDVVSLLLANTPEAQFALWGTQAVCVANPVNWMMEPEAIAEIMKASGSTVLFVYGGDALVDCWKKVEGIVASCPQLRTVIRIGGDSNGAPPHGVRFIEYDEVIDTFSSQLDPAGLPQGDAIAALFPTGGTTGLPKLARHTHAGVVTSAWLSAAVAGIQAGEARLSATPLFHVVGAYAGSLATLARGGRLVLATSAGWRHPDLVNHIWSVVRRYSIAYLTIVPTIMNQLVQRPMDRNDLVSLKGVLSGSAPLSEHVAQTFLQMSGFEVREGYGMTETTSVIMMNPRNGRVKTGSVGLPFPYHRVRIVRRDSDGTLADCPVGEAGVLLVNGPTMFAGYSDSVLDDDIWLEHGLWLNTGDIARVDKDGYVWIVGRAKDVIIRGGHNIDPKAIEEILYRHPDVVEAVVVGRPDSHAGEVPVAYVQLKSGASASTQDILEFVAAHVHERAAIPKSCCVAQEIPKSPMGKILRQPLRRSALEDGIRLILNKAGIAGGFRAEAMDGPAGSLKARVYLESSDIDDALARRALSGLSLEIDILRT